MDILPRRSAINKLVEITATDATNINQETTTISTNIPALIANVGNKNSDQQSFIKPGEVIDNTSRYVISKPLNYIPPPIPQNPLASQFERRFNVNLPSTP